MKQMIDDLPFQESGCTHSVSEESASSLGKAARELSFACPNCETQSVVLTPDKLGCPKCGVVNAK